MNRSLIISFISLMLAGTCLAFVDYGRRNGAAGARNARDEQMEQLRQGAAEFNQKIDQSLKSLLGEVNNNRRPDEALVKEAAETLESAKRYARVFDDKQKAAFMLLQSWVYFFEGNIPQSLNWSLRSCRTYEPAKDPWVTQALFYMLNGRQPMVPKPPRSQEQEQREQQRLQRQQQMRNMMRPMRNNQIAVATPTADPYTEQGVLDFDINGIRREYLKEQFKRFSLQTVSGDTINYVPGKDMLCMFFQQQAPSDANDLPMGQGDVMQGINPLAMDPTLASNTQHYSLKDQEAYFENLVKIFGSSNKVKFVLIDLSTQLSEVTQQAASKIPTVSAAMSGSGASLFAGVNALEPFMMIADIEGKTKYAGAAAGFVPAFILTELTGTPVDLSSSTTAAHGQQPSNIMRQLQQLLPLQQVGGQQPTNMTDPNTPAVDPNAIIETAKRMQQQPDFSIQELEDNVDATRLLNIARNDIELSRKRLGNPGDGIQAAREVLAKYPNTEYAQQARELLRRVPDPWKTRHNITNEELGY